MRKLSLMIIVRAFELHRQLRLNMQLFMNFMSFGKCNDMYTHGHKSKGVCSFLFFIVKSAPLAARKQAIDADAFLSVFWK